MAIATLFTTLTGGPASHKTAVLIKAATGGCERSFKALYDMHSGVMYAICLRYTGNTDTANDLFQEGWVKVYSNLASYSGVGNFEGWVKNIFKNACINATQRQSKVVFKELDEEIALQASSPTGIDKLSADEVIKALQQLPEKYRLIINLYCVDGYTHPEIAKLLQCSEAASKTQLCRAKALLIKNYLGRGD